eukprot:9263374-Pyramimonas_sp.AAC.1
MLTLDPNRRFDGSHRKPRKEQEGEGDDDGGGEGVPARRADFAPRRRLAGDRRGLGADTPTLENPGTMKAIQKICHHVRRVGRTPIVWHHSRATGLSKCNGKAGFSARRYIHGLCRMGVM